MGGEKSPLIHLINNTIYMGDHKDASVNFSEAAGHNASIKTGTDSSQAITMNARAGKITSSTNNLGAKTTEAITVTNKYCHADSIILASVEAGGAGDPVAGIVTPSEGSFTLTILNADPTNACDAVYKVNFLIINNPNE